MENLLYVVSRASTYSLYHRSSIKEMKKFSKYATLLVAVLFVAFGFASCSDDDDNGGGNGNGNGASSTSIVGTWRNSDVAEDEDGMVSLDMVLTFNNDNTGRIVETWAYSSRATTNETYTMDFQWTTTSDANGNDILKVSYVSGDRNTEVFAGGSNTVLWTRQYVLTGNILNVYGGDGVWVFNRQ